MRLRFEDWLDAQRFHEEANRLFQEAITCYKVGAYRASLLFAYLGFQTVLRDRLSRAPEPTGFVPGRWAAMQRKLRSEDEWDATVFDTTQQREPAVFVLTDDLRSQVMYWKNRRNDCAHGKDHNIGHPQVESFWLFLESRLPRFVVNGSRIQLTERIRRHFDRAITPVGRSISDLAGHVSVAVETPDLPAFLEDVERIFDEHDDPFIGEGMEEQVFYGTLLDSSPPPVIAALLDFFESRVDKLRPVLDGSPARVAHLRGREELVRRLWYGDRWLGCSAGVLCSMLTLRVIPDIEIGEAVRRAAQHLSDSRLAPEQVDTLREFGFDEQFRVAAFNEGRISEFAWANRNTRNVVEYLCRVPLDGDLVRRITATFDVRNHPYELRDALDELFRENAGIRGEFNRILGDEGIHPPRYLAGLSGDLTQHES